MSSPTSSMNSPTNIVVPGQGLESASKKNVEASSLSTIVKGKEKIYYSEDHETVLLHSHDTAQEKEILYLREQIAHASMTESQLLNEKYSLERKFSELRMALDEKQGESMTTAINELASRKGDLEVNFNLLNELKATDDERHIFTSSMLGILAEYGAWPHVTNAMALSNSIKSLHNQLQFRIRTSHAKLAELNSLIGNDTINGFINKEIPGLGVNGHLPISSVGMHGFSYYNNQKNGRHVEQDYEMSRYVKDFDLKPTKSLTPTVEMRQLPNDEIFLKTVTGIDRNEPGYDVDNVFSRNTLPSEIEQRTLKEASNPMTAPNGVNSFGLEEETPGIDNFQIIGEAKPGCKLLGCGYPVRGTYLCMFQWVRHYPDGTRQYIEGATNPDYVVTADDVDKLIAVECIPMDEQGRQGELVRIFANDHKKITCDEEMQEEIDSYIAKGQAKFNVLVLLDSSENWEQATLSLKRSGFQVKIETTQAAVITEKYCKDLSIKILSGLSTQFVLACANGSSYSFSTSNDIRMRDIIVLTMSIFQSKALEENRKVKA